MLTLATNGQFQPRPAFEPLAAHIVSSRSTQENGPIVYEQDRRPSPSRTEFESPWGYRAESSRATNLAWPNGRAADC